MPKRAGYHHGDLKTALVASALAPIAERGVAALSAAECPYSGLPGSGPVSDLAGKAAG